MSDAGEEVELEVQRDGAVRELTVEIGETDDASLRAAAVPLQKRQQLPQEQLPPQRAPQYEPFFRR